MQLAATFPTDSASHVFAANPFMQLTDRRAVVKTMYSSQSLRSLKSAKHCPLDKPWIAVTVDAAKKRMGLKSANLH